MQKFLKLNTRALKTSSLIELVDFSYKMILCGTCSNIFLSWYKTPIQPNLEYAIQTSPPIPYRDTEALEVRERPSAGLVRSSSPMATSILPYPLPDPWGSKLNVYDHPWPSGINQGVYLPSANLCSATR